MTKKIAVTGTHGAGKTTLAFKLAVHYKQQGYNVKVVQEVARSCPFPLNESMTKETALWIYHTHIQKELEAARTHDVVICDRTFYDSFVYAKCNNLKLVHTEQHALQNLEDSYNKIFLIRPDLPIKEDGVRSVDYEFQKKIDSAFKDLCDYFDVELKSSQIFDKEESWKQFCL